MCIRDSDGCTRSHRDRQTRRAFEGPNAGQSQDGRRLCLQQYFDCAHCPEDSSRLPPDGCACLVLERASGRRFSQRGLGTRGLPGDTALPGPPLPPRDHCAGAPRAGQCDFYVYGHDHPEVDPVLHRQRERLAADEVRCRWSVSYTHLDVYKRQRQPWTRRTATRTPHPRRRERVLRASWSPAAVFRPGCRSIRTRGSFPARRRRPARINSGLRLGTSAMVRLGP